MQHRCFSLSRVPAFVADSKRKTSNSRCIFSASLLSCDASMTANFWPQRTTGGGDDDHSQSKANRQ
jgi:hypothetical protein